MSALAKEAKAIAAIEGCTLEESKALLIEGLQKSEFGASAIKVETNHNGRACLDGGWINPEYWRISSYDWLTDRLVRDNSKLLPPKKQSTWIMDARTGERYERNEFVCAEGIVLMDCENGRARLHDRLIRNRLEAEREREARIADEIAQEQSPQSPPQAAARQKPKRPPGLSYAGMDEPFLIKMHSLMETRKVATATKAAERAIDEAAQSDTPVFGSGTRGSKISRLVRAYKSRFERAA